MTSKDLKSGITKEWLYKVRNAEGNLVDRDIFIDEYGYWNERMKDGSVVTYSEKDAYVIFHDARCVTNIPEEYRIAGFWLVINGIKVAPMTLLNYNNDTGRSQVVYSEKLNLEDGGRSIYTETLILDKNLGARVHVVLTVLDKDMKIVKDKCFFEFVSLE